VRENDRATANRVRHTWSTFSSCSPVCALARFGLIQWWRFGKRMSLATADTQMNPPLTGNSGASAAAYPLGGKRASALQLAGRTDTHWQPLATAASSEDIRPTAPKTEFLPQHRPMRRDVALGSSLTAALGSCRRRTSKGGRITS
jgi:hypothetical protein